MEPVSVIVAAVMAGTAAGAQETASEAVKAAYTRLRELLLRRFTGESDVGSELAEVERAPDQDASALERRLSEVGADRDEEVLAAARQLLAQVKYNVTVNDSKGVVIGENANVTMNFTE